MRARRHVISMLLLLAFGIGGIATPAVAQLNELELLSALDPDASFDCDRVQAIFGEDRTMVGAALLGNVRLLSPDLDIYADAIAVSKVPATAQPTSPAESGDSSAAPAEAAPPKFALRLVAVGNILVVRGRQSFRAETLLFNTETRQGRLTDARVRIDLDFIDRTRAFARDQRKNARFEIDQRALPAEPTRVRGEAPRLVMAAQVLTVENFQHFVGEGVSVTSCDFGHPHWQLSSQRAEVERFEVNGDDGRSQQHTLAKLQGSWLEFGGLPLVPLPNLSWNSQWSDNTALRSISYSNSSKFGNRVDTLWDGNLLLPQSWRRHFDLGLRLDYLGNRGIGWGADIRYGSRPAGWGTDLSLAPWIESYGEGTFYAIDDRGIDRNELPPEHSNRNRARLHHRSRFRSGTWVDVEYAVERDRNFFQEYFERELRSQKTPENIVYIRHPFAEDVTATLLIKRQLASYRSVVERLPEIGIDVLEHALGDSAWNLDVAARASQLRFVPDRALNSNSDRNLRADLRTTLARAVGKIGAAPYIKIRPFIEARFTAYEEDQIRNNRIERLALATGGALGTHVSRDFWPESDVFGWKRFRHVIDPEVRYRVVFENNVDPSQLFTYDPVDTVDKFEILTLSIRNTLFAARQVNAPPVTYASESATAEQAKASEAAGTETDNADTLGIAAAKTWQGRALIETDLQIDYFPDASRDNSSNNWGRLQGEALINPTAWLGLYLDGRYDTELDQRFDEFNTGIELRSQQGSRLRAENRYRRNLGHSLVLQGRWNASDKYSFEGFYEFDFRRQESVNVQYSVIRNFHRWACVFSLEVDEGEQDDVRFTVNFGPRELISSLTRDPRDR